MIKWIKGLFHKEPEPEPEPVRAAVEGRNAIHETARLVQYYSIIKTDNLNAQDKMRYKTAIRERCANLTAMGIDPPTNLTEARQMLGEYVDKVDADQYS